MSLTEEQTAKVRDWINDGLKLSEIQDRLSKDFDVHLLYMDVRMLVDDLKLTPKETQEAEPVKPAAPEPGAPGDLPPEGDGMEGALGGEPAGPGGGNVQVSVDQITRAGAMVSGKVTFSDAKTAEWYLDQYGRFGLVPPEPGYRPSQADLAQFQATLDRELQKIGY